MESEQKKKLKFAIFKKRRKKNFFLVTKCGVAWHQNFAAKQARLKKDGFEGLDFFLSDGHKMP